MVCSFVLFAAVVVAVHGHAIRGVDEVLRGTKPPSTFKREDCSVRSSSLSHFEWVPEPKQNTSIIQDKDCAAHSVVSATTASAASAGLVSRIQVENFQALDLDRNENFIRGSCLRPTGSSIRADFAQVHAEGFKHGLTRKGSICKSLIDDLIRTNSEHNFCENMPSFLVDECRLVLKAIKISLINTSRNFSDPNSTSILESEDETIQLYHLIRLVKTLEQEKPLTALRPCCTKDPIKFLQCYKEVLYPNICYPFLRIRAEGGTRCESSCIKKSFTSSPTATNRARQLYSVGECDSSNGVEDELLCDATHTRCEEVSSDPNRCLAPYQEGHTHPYAEIRKNGRRVYEPLEKNVGIESHCEEYKNEKETLENHRRNLPRATSAVYEDFAAKVQLDIGFYDDSGCSVINATSQQRDPNYPSMPGLCIYPKGVSGCYPFEKASLILNKTKRGYVRIDNRFPHDRCREMTKLLRNHRNLEDACDAYVPTSDDASSCEKVKAHLERILSFTCRIDSCPYVEAGNLHPTRYYEFFANLRDAYPTSNQTSIVHIHNDVQALLCAPWLTLPND